MRLEQFIESKLSTIKETINNSKITGHLSGRYLICRGYKNERKSIGGEYEENEYEYLDDYLSTFLSTALKEIVELHFKDIMVDARIINYGMIETEFDRGYVKSNNATIDQITSRHNKFLS